MTYTVKFKISESGYWRGNGFGNAGASWEAIVPGIGVVATYNGDARTGTTLASTYAVEPGNEFQSRMVWNRLMFVGVTRWKATIREQVARFSA